MAARQHDVTGLDVPVNDALAVRVAEAISHFPRQSPGFVDRKLTLAVDPIAQGFALHVWHHVIQKAVRFAGVVEREDVRVLEPSGRLDLAQETLGAQRGRQLRAQDFDRHLAAVFEVFGEIDHGHPATTELTIEGIAAGQRRFQALKGVGHEVLSD